MLLIKLLIVKYRTFMTMFINESSYFKNCKYVNLHNYNRAIWSCCNWSTCYFVKQGIDDKEASKVLFCLL